MLQSHWGKQWLEMLFKQNYCNSVPSACDLLVFETEGTKYETTCIQLPSSNWLWWLKAAIKLQLYRVSLLSVFSWTGLSWQSHAICLWLQLNVINLKSAAVYISVVLYWSQGQTPSLQRAVKFSSVQLCFNKTPVLLQSRNTWGSAPLGARSAYLKSYGTEPKFWHRAHGFESSSCANYTLVLITSPPLSFQLNEHSYSDNYHTHTGWKIRRAFRV